jgi:hypothetical protein
MIVENIQKFNQLIKKVEFCPFEWSSNLFAVVFSDNIISFFVYNEKNIFVEVSLLIEYIK